LSIGITTEATTAGLAKPAAGLTKSATTEPATAGLAKASARLAEAATTAARLTEAAATEAAAAGLGVEPPAATSTFFALSATGLTR
jgi:hypothetical protein